MVDVFSDRPLAGNALCVVLDPTPDPMMQAARGIAEDPGTGSAAGTIGLLAAKVWGTVTDVTICQGDEIGRPRRIDAHEWGGVRVGGRVSVCASGAFTL